MYKRLKSKMWNELSVQYDFSRLFQLNMKLFSKSSQYFLFWNRNIYMDLYIAEYIPLRCLFYSSIFSDILITAHQRMINDQTRKNDKAVIIFASKLYQAKADKFPIQ